MVLCEARKLSLPLLHPCCSREQLVKEYEAMPTKEGAGQQVGGAPVGHLTAGGMRSDRLGAIGHTDVQTTACAGCLSGPC